MLTNVVGPPQLKHRKGINMPRGKAAIEQYLEEKNKRPINPRKKTYKERAEFSGWVNVAIPTADKDKVSAWGQTSAYADAFSDLVQQGLKITIGYDDEEGVFVASTFQTRVDHPCAGIMTSQRSDDIWRALLKLVYSHSEILPPDYSGLLGGREGSW